MLLCDRKHPDTRECATETEFRCIKTAKAVGSDQTNSFLPLAPGGLKHADRFDEEDLAKFGYSSERKEENFQFFI